MVGLGWACALSGCATQKDTSKALSVAGAAAVIVGATMASSTQCYDALPATGGGNANCAPSLSRGARQAGTALAAAGAGVAAAGYALEPKGPDVKKRPAKSSPEPAFERPRLPRREPDPPSVPETATTPGVTLAGEATGADASGPCRPSGSASDPAAPGGEGPACPSPSSGPEAPRTAR